MATRSPPPPPTPTTVREFAEISQAEYDSWLTPEAMLAAMPYGMLSATQLERELRAERYLSAADEVIWAFEGKTGRDRLARLPAWLWTIVMPAAAADFWHTGYLEAWIPEGGGYVISSGNWLHVYGVRFWYPGLQAPAGVTQGAKASSGSSADRIGNLSTADAERFCRAIVAGWPDSTREFARAKALLFFPDKKVPRDWFFGVFRSIQGHRNPGKQPKTRE
jgi:hypothetical protein